MKNIKTIIITCISLCVLYSFIGQNMPTLYLIGDSTVKNGADDGQNKGADGLWGWGHFLGEYFKIHVVNDALGGTSSRTFFTNPKRWQATLIKIKPGDFLMLQFGHNDPSPLNDSIRARGTIKGNGEESQAIHNILTQQDETVHSYGWYIRQFIADATARGATVIVCSPIPLNSWSADGMVRRNSESYGLWAQQAAEQSHAFFLPLNKLIADIYDSEGQTFVKAKYFHADSIHTIQAGAKLNASEVIRGIKDLKACTLKNHLK